MDRLLSKGYEARHIILEPTFKVGHNQQVYGDILVLNQNFENLILIENKTYGKEFDKEWQNMPKDGGQLFSYYAVNKTPFLCLLAYDFDLNKIIYKSHIITTKDNKEHLKLVNDGVEKDKQKLGFEDSANANAKDYFKVWSETYQFATTTKGLFEDDILPYLVGKEKYTLSDLQVVPYSEITNIYHAFATILRNNAIGNYENTFYVLVDLFLCKIIDEQSNPQDLQFYYKGVSYDNPFHYIDRLLNLYEKGIDTLFKKKVVNISKSQIDSLFTQAKRYKGEFKAKIESIFDKQKYFNIKKFNFIEVENEEEFFINFKVLIQISNLIQDFYISKSENNQFLGDLFEGFLNRSVHQTEGRFFTPTPITNFIISSLPPLCTQPKVLDFACGAGHFLTEFITHNQNANLYGIEKNKDLSKVAKTACVLHNANSANVIFQDALDFVKEAFARDFENGSFDVIISNPPYSVKGFLNTLTPKALANFELSQSIDTKSYDKNGSIECFFIERAKQFLKENGLLVLVLPVSVLQKGQIYEKTREILFAHFKILAFVELNSRTFGSTGTQTIILFAKRVEKYAKDLICALKEANFDDGLIANDFDKKDFVKSYCDFMGYDYDEFRAFMRGDNPAQEFLQNEVFKDYKSDFDSTKPKVFKKIAIKESDKKDLFEQSSFFVQNLSQKESKQALNNFEKSKEFTEATKAFYFKQFLAQIRHLEQEKMLYYALIYDEKVLVLKSPNDKNAQNKSNKANIVKFLGYDWSKRKGDEGIKYQTTTLESSTQNDDELKEGKDDSDEEKKSKEALRNINSVKFINTPLYNPNDKEDKNKLAFAIKSFICAQNGDLDKQNELDTLLQNLQSKETDSYSLFVSDLKSMIDFTRAEFSKAISLNPANSLDSSLRGSGANAAIQNPFADSKFELVRLGEFLQSNGKGKRPASFANQNGIYPFIKSSKIIEKCNEADFDMEALVIGDGGGANIHYLNGKFSCSDHTYIFTNNKKDILLKFFYEIINANLEILEAGFKGIALKNISKTFIENIKIPLPPLEIQRQIISECESVESKSQNTRDLIELYKDLISAVLNKCGISQSTHTNADSLIESLLSQISTLQSNLDPLLCHTERSEVSQQNLQNRDISPTAQNNKMGNAQNGEIKNAQNDKTDSNNGLPRVSSETLAMTEDSPSLAEGARGRVKSPDLSLRDSRSESKQSTHDLSLRGSEATEAIHESKMDCHDLTSSNLAMTDLLKSLPAPPKNGWDKVALGEVCSVASGGTPKREVAQFWNGNINWLKSEVCQNCYVYENQVSEKITELGLQKSSAKMLKKNSVLIALVGATIGKIGYLTFESTTNQNIAGLYPLNEKNLMTKFLYFATMGLYPKFKERAGFNMANLTFIKNLKIPLPPLKEQEKIISCIEAIESKIATLDSTLPALESAKSQILQKYLT